MKTISLYIHIPFCVKKCGYCDFLSFDYSKKEMAHYLLYLKKELIMHASKYTYDEVSTIFIGGGTPSLMSGQEMLDLMAVIKKYYKLSDNIEISMESNPGTLNFEKVQAYKQAGINRMSMGVQTLEDETLKALDRIHDVKMVYESVENIKKAGLSNFNMDLMFGLPGQTLKQLIHTVEEMIKLDPTHISAYSLKYEEGTKFYEALSVGELEEIEDELDREMYALIIKKLYEAGYEQYEISNFAKPNFECRHNLVYWDKKDYIGIGLGAHGCYDMTRPYNVSNLNDYYRLIDEDQIPMLGFDSISQEDDEFETIILSLRLNRGLNIDVFNTKFKVNFETKYEKELLSLIENGLLIHKNAIIKLTDKGRDLSNQVFIKFLL